jgi:hypothetical protein
MLLSHGQYRVPIDSGYGDVYRPFATGYSDQRILTLETLYDFFINHVPDPDSAMIQDANFDEKLENHPDVASAMRIRELTVASLPWRIDPSEATGIDPSTAEQIRSYVEDVIKNLPNLVEFYRQMERAVLQGGHGHEFVWARDSLGRERPVEYFPVHKSRFVFDRVGNMAILTRTTPVWGAYVNKSPTRMPDGEMAWDTPGGRFIYHKYMAEGGPFGRPASEGYIYWGRGEDTRLFIPVTFDHFVMRFRMKWLEKHGMPHTVLWHPDNWHDEDVRKIARSARGEAVTMIPKPPGKAKDHFFDLDWKEPSKMGYDAFQEFQDKWVKVRVDRLLLGAANTQDDGEKGGYAGKAMLREAGPQIIFRYDAGNISDTLNSQIIPYIVWGQWPGCPKEYFPKHVMEPKEEKDEKARLEVAQLAAQLVPLRKDEVYDAAGFTRPKEGDEDTVFTGGQEDPFAGMGGMGGGGPAELPGTSGGGDMSINPRNPITDSNPDEHAEQRDARLQQQPTAA